MTLASKLFWTGTLINALSFLFFMLSMGVKDDTWLADRLTDVGVLAMMAGVAIMFTSGMVGIWTQ